MEDFYFTSDSARKIVKTAKNMGNMMIFVKLYERSRQKGILCKNDITWSFISVFILKNFKLPAKRDQSRVVAYDYFVYFSKFVKFRGYLMIKM